MVHHNTITADSEKDTKEYILMVLERARQNELELCAQVEHIERLHRIMNMPRLNRDNSEKYLSKLTQLEQRLNEQIDNSVAAKNEALSLVEILTGEERGVIESYFIRGKTWEQIADKMYMSDRRVFLIRKKALRRIARKIEEDA